MHQGLRSGGSAHLPASGPKAASPGSLSRRLALTLAFAALVGGSVAVPNGARAEDQPAGTPTEAPATPTDAPAPPAATSPEATPVPTGPVGGEHYDMKLRELEEKVVTLKEKIFRSKTRLLLLKERVLNDVIAEAKAVIVHVDEMGSSFKLQSVLYHLDGEKIYYQDAASGVLSKERVEIFTNNVLPGNHVLSVEMVYKGDSTVFAYLKDYTFKLRTNYTFYATKGKITTVQTVGYLKGDITWDLTKRPSITFRVSQSSYTKDAAEEAPSAGGLK